MQLQADQSGGAMAAFPDQASEQGRSSSSHWTRSPQSTKPNRQNKGLQIPQRFWGLAQVNRCQSNGLLGVSRLAVGSLTTKSTFYFRRRFCWQPVMHKRGTSPRACSCWRAMIDCPEDASLSTSRLSLKGTRLPAPV